MGPFVLDIKQDANIGHKEDLHRERRLDRGWIGRPERGGGVVTLSLER